MRAISVVNGKFGIDEDNELIRYAREYGVDILSSDGETSTLPGGQRSQSLCSGWTGTSASSACAACAPAPRSRDALSGRSRTAGIRPELWPAMIRPCSPLAANPAAPAWHTVRPARSTIRCPSTQGGPTASCSTTCTYCGVGCQLDLNVKDGKVIRVTSNREADGSSVNGLHLCIKGRYGYEFIHHPRRHKRPRVREYLLKGEPRPAKPRKICGCGLGHRP